MSHVFPGETTPVSGKNLQVGNREAFVLLPRPRILEAAGRATRTAHLLKITFHSCEVRMETAGATSEFSCRLMHVGTSA